MNLIVAAKMAKELMARYGVDDWTFRYDNGKRRFGSCRPGSKLITLSIHLTQLNDEKEVRDTILHEIAHALAPDLTHDEAWKCIARSIGCTGSRCYGDEVLIPEGKWIGSCPVCPYKTRRRHRRREASCGRCQPNKYDSRFRLVWALAA